MRIIITENQLNLLLLEEDNKQKVIFGDYIKKGVNIAKKLTSRGFSIEQASVIVGNMWGETTLDWTSGNSVDGPYGLLQWRGDRLLVVALCRANGSEDIHIESRSGGLCCVALNAR